MQRMSLSITISFLSGRQTVVQAQADWTVNDLRVASTCSAGVAIDRLLTADGRVLEGSTTLSQAAVQDEDTLTATLRQTAIAANAQAFAKISFEVVTWGYPSSGGDGRPLAMQDAWRVQRTLRAFAAICGDGRVATWGDKAGGGDSSRVQNRLRGVKAIQASDGAFAAILRDGSVVSWGHLGFGGDCRRAQDRLQNVREIQASSRAFAAILEDRTVVTWGRPDVGGDSEAEQEDLRDVCASSQAPELESCDSLVVLKVSSGSSMG